MTGNMIMDYSLLILFLPLAAFTIQIFIGKRLPRQGDWVSISAILTTLVLSIAMFTSMLLGHDPHFSQQASFTWLDMGAFKIELGFLVDNITIVMLLVVALISSMTHIFSIKYMEGDIRYSRYYAYLGLFTFSMNGIVLANNLISMYMFWELVGVSSYLLISHWFEKESAADAAKKAFLTNRVGDIGFFIGIMLIFSTLGTFTFSEIFDSIAAGKMGGGLLTAAGIGLFFGAMGKSSQFPLHIWLPDAMEGPTPVSALMHAATMVAAGVYLSVRLFPLFTPEALVFIAYVGGFTAMFAASIAITQNDIKKVLAYSTVSQLGYMILSVGTGAYVAGFKEKMPITYWSMLISTLSISGVPLFSGFLSKDAILAGTFSFASHHPEHFLLPVFGFGAAAITAFYMFRLIFMTFHGKPQMEEIYSDVHESPKEMTFPLILLSGLSIFVFYTLPYFNPFSDHGWFTDLIKASDSAVPGNPTAHYIAMAISLLVAGAGIFLSWSMYFKKKLSAKTYAEKMGPMYKLSLNKYFFDENYNSYLYQPFLKLSRMVAHIDWDLYDKYFINGFGRVTKVISFFTGRMDYDGLDQTIVDGIGRSARRTGGTLKYLQTGRLQNYLLFALLGVVVIVLVQSF